MDIKKYKIYYKLKKSRNTLFENKKLENFNKKDINNIKEIAIFKKEYKPFFENDYYKNAMKYSFNLTNKEFNTFYSNQFEEIFYLFSKYDFIVGIRILFHKQNIQLWTNHYELNKSLIEYIQKKYNVKDKDMYNRLFFPLPVSNKLPYLSKTFLRNKTIYYLRFGLNIGQGFYKNFYWDESMINDFKKYYKPNTNMLDIGSHIGTTGMLMAEIISKGYKVYAFEPVYYDIVERNIKANKLNDKMELYSIGLGNKDYKTIIQVYDRMEIVPFGSIRIHEKQDLRKIDQEIEVKKLDSLKLDNISIIKIDVEGMEKYVLEGGIETILKNKPVIFIEVLKNEYNSFISSPIYKRLQKEGNYKLIPQTGDFRVDDYILISK